MQNTLSVMTLQTKMKQLGKAVARERKAQHLSQEMLGKMANTTQTEISNIKNAKTNVSIVTLIKISEALNIETREFFSF